MGTKNCHSSSVCVRVYRDLEEINYLKFHSIKYLIHACYMLADASIFFPENICFWICNLSCGEKHLVVKTLHLYWSQNQINIHVKYDKNKGPMCTIKCRTQIKAWYYWQALHTTTPTKESPQTQQLLLNNTILALLRRMVPAWLDFTHMLISTLFSSQYWFTENTE